MPKYLAVWPSIVWVCMRVLITHSGFVHTFVVMPAPIAAVTRVSLCPPRIVDTCQKCHLPNRCRRAVSGATSPCCASVLFSDWYTVKYIAHVGTRENSVGYNPRKNPTKPSCDQMCRVVLAMLECVALWRCVTCCRVFTKSSGAKNSCQHIFNNCKDTHL